MGWKLGKLFPSCLNVLVSENESKECRILKLFVEVDLEKPLLRGIKIRLEEASVWVDFKYEQFASIVLLLSIPRPL